MATLAGAVCNYDTAKSNAVAEDHKSVKGTHLNFAMTEEDVMHTLSKLYSTREQLFAETAMGIGIDTRVFKEVAYHGSQM